jgi:serine/threonine protein kinase
MPLAECRLIGGVIGENALLTGHSVFEATTPFQMIAKHLQEPPVPPSVRSSRPVDSGLEQVLMRCLAKAPADRPSTAVALDRLLTEIAIEPWTEEQARRWWTTAVVARSAG